jgi:hypothetical protein
MAFISLSSIGTYYILSSDRLIDTITVLSSDQVK